MEYLEHRTHALGCLFAKTFDHCLLEYVVNGGNLSCFPKLFR